jgi:hypothetical protein
MKMSECIYIDVCNAEVLLVLLVLHGIVIAAAATAASIDMA